MEEENWLYMPREDWERLHRRDLNESCQCRCFLYPHKGQVEALNLIRVETNLVAEKKDAAMDGNFIVDGVASNFYGD